MATRTRTRGGWERQPAVRGGLTTTHPVHAARGGLSLLLVPLGGLMALAPLAGVLFYWLTASQGLQWLAPVLAVTGYAVTYITFQHAAPRHPWDRRRAGLTIAWLTTVWTWAGWFGLSAAWIGLVWTTGLPLGLWWFIVKTEPVRGYGGDGHGGDSEWAKSIGLADSARPRVKKNDENELRVRVEHEDDTHEDVQKALPKIAARGHSTVDGWTWEPVVVEGNVLAHLSDLVYRRNQRLKAPGTWAGPYRPGAGAWEPIPYGLAADGALSEVCMFPTAERVGTPAHAVVGTSGAAKTVFTKNVVGELVARRGVVLWGGDPSKAAQWVSFCRPALMWFTEQPREMELQFKVLAEIVRVNTQLLAKRGLSRWTEDAWEKHRIPGIVYILEESAKVQDMLEDALKRGVEVWRSAGVHVVMVIQRASESNISTDLRNLITEWLCFRVQKEVDAGMALSDETIDAGAKPWKIPLKGQEGTHWAELSTEDATRWAMKRRTFRDDNEALVRAVARYAPDMAALHPAQLAACDRIAGEKWWNRERVGLWEWAKSQWSQPLLLLPGIAELVDRSEPLARELTPLEADIANGADDDPEPPRPGRAAAKPTFTPPPPNDDDPDDEDEDDDMEPADETALDDLEDDEGTEPGGQGEAEAFDTDRILAEIDAEVRDELGDDEDEEEEVGDVDPDDILRQAEAGNVSGIDYTVPHENPGPTPSREQRAANLLILVREFLDDDALRQQGPDGTWWVVADTDRLVKRWRQFRGEDMRPPLYRRLHAYERQGLVRDVGRGVWAISARVLDETPLVLPDDWDPADDPMSVEDMQALVDELAG